MLRPRRRRRLVIACFNCGRIAQIPAKRTRIAQLTASRRRRSGRNRKNHGKWTFPEAVAPPATRVTRKISLGVAKRQPRTPWPSSLAPCRHAEIYASDLAEGSFESRCHRRRDGDIQNVDAPTLPETGRTISAPPVVALPWRVTARCPIVDPNLAPGRSAIPVGVAALRLAMRRPLRLLGCGSPLMRLRRACGRGHCFARFAKSPGWPALAAGIISSMMLAGGGAMRPRGTAAVAGRSVGTRTTRGLRSLTRPQSRSDRVSPTQDGLSAAAGAP